MARVARSRGRYLPGGGRRYVEQRIGILWRQMHRERRYARSRSNVDKGDARREARRLGEWLRDLLMIRRLMGG